MRGWIAAISIDDVLRRQARLHLANERSDGQVEFLMSDGTFETHPGEQLVEGSGLWLPSASLVAVYDALAEWRGLQTHQATEAKVLREWLGVERERVDALIHVVATRGGEVAGMRGESG